MSRLLRAMQAIPKVLRVSFKQVRTKRVQESHQDSRVTKTLFKRVTKTHKIRKILETFPQEWLSAQEWT